MISIISRDDVVTSARAALGLAEGTGIDDTYLSEVVRKVAGLKCPCSPKTLLKLIIESHGSLTDNQEALADRTRAVIESLLAVGDLLELNNVTTLDETVRGTWIFAAPPSFVILPSGRAFILGLSADEVTPLPAELRARIQYRNAARYIGSSPSENLGATLRELGLRELTSESWLRCPKLEAPSALIATLDTKLSSQGASGEIQELRVLDHTRDIMRYRERWVSPTTQSGRFIVRRPQAYGADLWGYAELQHGKPVKMLDFPTPGARWRACDLAWRAQMAIDAEAGNAQPYTATSMGDTVRLDFSSPIPDWARRRLSVVGEQVAPKASLLSFVVSNSELKGEEDFLLNYLFLNRAAI